MVSVRYFHELAWTFYAVRVASGQRTTLVGPEFAADEGESVCKG
jgi:hypothetical protein